MCACLCVCLSVCLCVCVSVCVSVCVLVSMKGITSSLTLGGARQEHQSAALQQRLNQLEGESTSLQDAYQRTLQVSRGGVSAATVCMCLLCVSLCLNEARTEQELTQEREQKDELLSRAVTAEKDLQSKTVGEDVLLGARTALSVSVAFGCTLALGVLACALGVLACACGACLFACDHRVLSALLKPCHILCC